MIHSENTRSSPIEKAEKFDTSSDSFKKLLGGGLPTCAITDVYGAAATGKTQFAFQNALIASLQYAGTDETEPAVIFVDCAGSFRPERIAEMAESRGVTTPHKVLDRISSIYVRSVADQKHANERILNSDLFPRSKLLIVDDITTNFAVEYPGESEDREDTYIARYLELSTYVRNLAYIALARKMAVLLTNSVRSRISPQTDSKVPTSSVEVETTGDIISQFVLFRLHFTKSGTRRQATVVQPFVSNPVANFSIERKGIVP
jgi:DNA repair protein RadA